MGFVAVSRPDALELIDTISRTDRIAVFVGSGVSAESGIPAWRQFILGLLERAFDAAFNADPSAAKEWAESILDSQQVTGAAAVVRALAPNDDVFADWLVAELYQESSPSMFQPGPIANAVAGLRRELGSAMVIATTNYDDLLEKALRGAGFAARDVRPYIRRRERMAPGAVPVVHLHGYAGGAGRKGKLVLSEEEYTRMQRGVTWQEDYVTDLLRARPCLFVGTSLVDPNLIRYLYGYGGNAARHWAVFARQSDEPRSGPVAEAREKALAARWGRCGVKTLFVDHYADVAQLLNEIRVAHTSRRTDVDYVDAATRAAHWVADFEAAILGIDDTSAFAEAQEEMATLLHHQLENAMAIPRSVGTDLSAERLGVSLWIVDSSGSRLVNWAAGHEVHRCPGVVRWVDIDPASEWAAAKSYCRGTSVQLDLPSGSPWGSVLALPLHVPCAEAAGGVLPVGAIQLNSSARLADTLLAKDKADGSSGLGDRMLAVIADGVASALTLMNPGPTTTVATQERGIV